MIDAVHEPWFKRIDEKWGLRELWYLWLMLLAGAVIVVGISAWGITRDIGRTEACAAHGWDRAEVRGPLCVDGNGVVHLP